MTDERGEVDTAPAVPSTGPLRLATGLADLAGMIRFFSRLPVPRLSPVDDPAALPDFARAVPLLPVAGLVVAGPAALLLFGLGQTALPPLAAAGLALAALLATTGALHEDGLADTADGFGGGATRERKLAIMKDSRIGAYGAAALVLSILVRAALIAGLFTAAGAAAAALALLAAAALSRGLAVGVMAALPPARADGAAAAAGRLPWTSAVRAALAGAALAAALLSLHAAPLAILLAIVVPAAAVAAIAALARRQIGGQTGDVIGAAQQAAEIGVWVAVTAVTG